MRGTTWPTLAKVREWTLGVIAHSRGAAGDGGHYGYERGPGAMWGGSVAVPPMATADALAFRAFVHSLRGKSGSFYFTVPNRSTGADYCSSRPGGKSQFSDCTRFSDGNMFSDAWTGGAGALTGTTATATASGASTITVTSATGIQVGDTMLAGGQLMRVTGITGNVLDVRPRVRTAIASGASYSINAGGALFRLASDTPVIPLIPSRSLEVSLELEEFY